MKKYVFFSVLVLIMWACGGSTDNSQATEEKTEDHKESMSPSQSASQNESEQAPKKKILIFGNSLTAGYGLDNPMDGFAGLIQRKLEDLGLPYEVVNGGISGETSSDGKGRIKWMMRQPVDIFVLELGANDGLRGINPGATHDNLQFILETVKESYPDAKLLVTGMEAPPNMGEAYTEDFRSIYPKLAEDNGAVLMPFLLEGVAGEAELNQSDAIHPTEEGHQIVAENLWAILTDMIEEVN